MTIKTSIFYLASVLLTFPLMASDRQPVGSLDDLRWQYRILIIKQGQYQASAVQVLNSNSTGVEERDLLWFSLQQDTLETNAAFQSKDTLINELKSRIKTMPDSVVLIGKDGYPKYTSETLDIRELFAIIDGMPMRKREIAQKEEK